MWLRHGGTRAAENWSEGIKMRTIGAIAMFISSGLVLAGAQDLPSNYRVQFENAWVRVTGVHYAPL